MTTQQSTLSQETSHYYDYNFRGTEYRGKHYYSLGYTDEFKAVETSTFTLYGPGGKVYELQDWAIDDMQVINKLMKKMSKLYHAFDKDQLEELLYFQGFMTKKDEEKYVEGKISEKYVGLA